MKLPPIVLWTVWLPLAALLYLRSWFTRTFHTPSQFMLEAVALAILASVFLFLRRRWPRLDVLALALIVLAPPLWRHPLASLVTLATLAAALAAGRSAMDALHLTPKSAAARIAIAAGIGLSAWIVILLALGAAGFLRADVIVALVAVAILVFRRGLVEIARVLRETCTAWNLPGAYAGLQVFALLAFAAVLQPVILTPSLLYDALATHLAASKNYAIHHSLAPSSEYDFLPQGLELMMAAADTLGAQPAEQMVEPLFLGFSWLAVYALARKTIRSRETAFAGATLAISLPFAAWDGAVVKNDIAAAFFLLAALLVFLEWLDSRRAPWIVVAAFLCAGAENIKHTALLGIAPLAILFLLAAWREPRLAPTIAAAIAVFLLFGGFWMVRAAVMRGDPVYPLRSAGAMEPMATAVFHSVAGRLAFLFHVQFDGQPVFEGSSTTRLGPLFLLFLPAIFWGRRKSLRAPAAACLLFSFLYLILWLWTWPVLRYAAAPLMLAAAGITALFARALHRAAPLLFVAVTFCDLCNFGNLLGMSVNLDRVKYLARLSTDDSYLRANLPAYAAISYTRDHARPGDRILAVGARSLAYAAEPAAMSSPFPDAGPFDPAEIRRAIDHGNFAFAIVPSRVDARAIFGPRAPQFADSNFGVYSIPRQANP